MFPFSPSSSSPNGTRHDHRDSLRALPTLPLTFPTIILSKTSSSSLDMTTRPLMALRMSCRLDLTTFVSLLKRISSWMSTVFIDSMYMTLNLFWVREKERETRDDRCEDLSSSFSPIYLTPGCQGIDHIQTISDHL